jgi:hypothetical protein
MFRTPQQPLVSLAEKKATPNSQTVVSNGATCVKKPVPQCHEE